MSMGAALNSSNVTGLQGRLISTGSSAGQVGVFHGLSPVFFEKYIAYRSREKYPVKSGYFSIIQLFCKKYSPAFTKREAGVL